MSDAVAWWESELRVLRRAQPISPVDWVQQHRWLDTVNHAEPGPMDLDVTPYVRGILDSYADPRCRELYLMGPAQWGKTETILNLIGYTACRDPSPTLVSLATQTDGESFIRRRLKPAIEASAEWNAERTGSDGDYTSQEIGFRSMVLFLGWPGSASRFASRSIGRVFLDEVDKYQAIASEGPPIDLARQRLRWWRNSKLVASSTPTFEHGPIFKLWKKSDRRWYWVPCEKCGAFQPLEFERERIVWPEKASDEEIEQHSLAKYVCRECGHQHADDERTRKAMNLRGVWCPTGNKVERDGTVTGPVDMRAARRGFHLNALYSPRVSWSETAAEFIRAKRAGIAELQAWTRNSKGWAWRERDRVIEIDSLRKRADEEHERGVVPDRCVVLTAGIDWQGDRRVWIVTGWAPGERTWTVDFGAAYDLEDLFDVLTRAWPKRSGGTCMLARVFVDSQYETDSVLRFCLRRPELLVPLIAKREAAVPISWHRIERAVDGRPVGILRAQLWSTFFKDQAHAALTTEDVDDPRAWRPPKNPPDDFLAELASEERVVLRDKRGVQRRAWVQRGNAPNHWWDALVYSYAAAQSVHLYRSLREGSEPAKPVPKPVQRRGFVRRRDDDGPRRGGIVRRRGD